MRKKRQQNQRRRQRNWSQKNFTGRLKYLAKNSQKKCPPEKYGIMQ